MFVASRVESGDEGKALAALVPQVIGTIQTVTGCGTLRRAGGIAVRVVAGDPICQGDVIETASDGWIGIRFIDGTVFNLSRSTRVMVNEFVCDSNGTSHSPVFGVTRGTFAFIGGQIEKTGCLRVETPVGSIRGRAHTGGIGTLSLLALTFAVMNEVQAADPNVTFLDDGSITYKDLEHGVFELVTKETIPRHIFVENPGETIVLHPRGSSISVNEITNTAARMAELQAAQQDALSTYAKGLDEAGSSTPPFAGHLPVQPINFIEDDDLPALLNSFPPPPSVFITVPDIFSAPPSPPTLHTATGPIEIDTVTFDNFAATTGTFVASSSNGATLTYSIGGETTHSTALGGVTYDVSSTGPYGTLYLNSTTGAYAFVPDSDAINALTTPTTESFTIRVSDGALSADQIFTIAINGTNDAAVISGTATGSAIEAGGVANAAHGPPTATGTLTDADVDNTPNTFTAVSSPTASAGGHGTFTMTSAGVWTYTLNDADSAVQALNVGGTLTDTFTVKTVDGTAQVVTVTIHGTNDAAIISGLTAGSVIEASYDHHGTPAATGMLTDTDVDNVPNTFTPVNSPTVSDAGYGSFTMSADGMWNYTLDNANGAVQALNISDTLTDTFTVTTVDGTAQVVTVTIHGTNDDAIISGTTAGSVIEASCDNPGHPTATGTLTDTDVDNTPNTFTPVDSPTPSDSGYGTFTMTGDGVWSYALDNANSAVQALNTCDTLTDRFTVTAIDGTAQLVTITIHGTNDAAIISGTTTGCVIEAGCDTPGQPTAIGTLTDTDVDNASNTFAPVCSPTESNAGYGAFTMTADGVWTYKLDNDNCAVQALNACDTLTDCFTVTTVDGTAQVITITIQGTDDADRDDFHSGAHRFEPSSIAHAVFGSPNTLAPGDSFHFKQEVSGVAGSGATNLADGGHAATPIGEAADGAHGTPTVSATAPTIELSLWGQHAADNSTFGPQPTAGTVVSHVLHDLMV